MNVSPELETTVAAVGSKTTYAGAGTVGIGWMLSNEFAVLMGILIGLAGLGVNAYYKHRRERRERAESEQRMRIALEEHEARMRGEL